MNVKLFKLINGQELVAEVLSRNSDGYVIKNPLVVQIVRGQDGSPQLGFMEWSMILKEDQEIQLNSTALVCDALEIMSEVSHSYEQQMSSLILPPEPSGKILLG